LQRADRDPAAAERNLVAMRRVAMRRRHALQTKESISLHAYGLSLLDCEIHGQLGVAENRHFRELGCDHITEAASDIGLCHEDRLISV
jgi:hypothetical protein